MSRGQRYHKGLEAESKASTKLHNKGLPILVEPKVLRDLGAGQVDLCIMETLRGHQLISIYEVKCFPEINYKQRKRLLDSAHVLSEIFNLSCRITLYDAAG